MGSDADYIMDSMGGFDSDGLPNFMNEIGSGDNTYAEVKDSNHLPTESISEYVLLAERGDIDAQNDLAVVYGEAKNFEGAFKWATIASEQGHAKAQVHLGLLYAEGKGVSNSAEAALKWFTLAAEQGDKWGQFFVGLMYYNGSGVTQNHEEAIKWHTLAAEKRLAGTQEYLGGLYWDRSTDSQGITFPPLLALREVSSD